MCQRGGERREEEHRSPSALSMERRYNLER